MTLTENQIIDPMIRELLSTAATGEAARIFLQSKLGGYVAQKAAEDVEEAIALLCEVSPTDSVQIAALQTRINVAKQSICYLTEAMSAGEHALRQLDDES